MAITRAQQVRQMLEDGGMLVQPSVTGKRPGYRGDAAARSTGAAQSGRADPGERGDPGEGANRAGDFAPTRGEPAFTSPDRFVKVDKDVIKEQKQNYEKQFFDKGKVPPLGSRPVGFKTKLNQFNLQKRLNYINNLQEQIRNKLNKGLIDYQEEEGQIQGLTDFDTLESYIDKVQSVQDLVDKGFYKPDGQFAKGEKIPDFPTTDLPGVLGIAQDIFAGPVTSDKLKQLNEQLTTLEGLKTTEGLEGTTFKDLMKEYQPNRFEREYGDPKDDRGPSDPCKGPNPPAYCFVGIRSVEPEVEPEEEEPFRLARRFRAEGGIMNSDIVGGEFDFESARQMYGLGKLVKKVTRTVKKIAKSPVGKIAIAAGIAGMPFGGGKFFGSGSLFGKAKPFLMDSIFGKVTDLGIAGPNRAARTGGLLDMIGGKVGAGIIGTSLAAGLLTPEQEEEAQELARGEGIDIEAARNAILAARQDDFRARRFRAEGGSMKEPVAKKTMPLLDMDGKEMDLRAEGGFVPIGRMEKADDVPARLSKNEFVFTADAVRNAGDGDVDKGAEVMYNMMKNLESGGDVSEESQGLEGARKMFQTSQRLEEVL